MVETTFRKKKKSRDNSNSDSFDSRIVLITRPTTVKKGGRTFSFSAVAVVGDGNGRVGFGRGKAKEVVLAVKKANDNARKNMRTISLRDGTVQYKIVGCYGATKVIILPGAEGTGIIAGGAMRPVFEVLGIKNVIAKCIGSRNPLNVVRATIESLVNIVSPLEIAKKRGKSLSEIFGKKQKKIRE